MCAYNIIKKKGTAACNLFNLPSGKQNGGTRSLSDNEASAAVDKCFAHSSSSLTSAGMHASTRQRLLRILISLELKFYFQYFREFRYRKASGDNRNNSPS